MTTISLEEVKKLATLSALKISDEEATKLQEELQNILAFVEQLDAVDTTGVEPTYQVTGLENVWREDEMIDYKLDRDALLKNAPDSQDGQIKVKRVLTLHNSYSAGSGHSGTTPAIPSSALNVATATSRHMSETSDIAPEHPSGQHSTSDGGLA